MSPTEKEQSSPAPSKRRTSTSDANDAKSAEAKGGLGPYFVRVSMMIQADDG
jgi:hypothetical protein